MSGYTICPCWEWPLECDPCLERTKHDLSSGAGHRGYRWAVKVAFLCRGRRGEPWPSYEGRVVEIATRWIRDFSRDPRAIEHFARACYDGAAEAWSGKDAWWWLGEDGRERANPLIPPRWLMRTAKRS